MERGEDPGAAARPDPAGRAEEAAEQRGAATAVRRQGQPGRALDREADGRRLRHRNGHAGRLEKLTNSPPVIASGRFL